MSPAWNSVALRAVLLASIPAASTSTTVAAPLLSLSSKQIAAAGAHGTGCSWSLGYGSGILFAAADDRAAVRLAHGVVALRPAADAKDLFPFTFDRWREPGVSIGIRPAGRSARKGAEATIRRAVLTVSTGGKALELRGRLECGS